jgi:hypothetical protein
LPSKKTKTIIEVIIPKKNMTRSSLGLANPAKKKEPMKRDESKEQQEETLAVTQEPKREFGIMKELGKMKT